MGYMKKIFGRRLSVLLILSAGIISIVILSGCLNNTMIKYYRPGGSEKIQYYVGGYEITVHFDAIAVYDIIGTDSFRVDIETNYTGKIKDTSAIGHIPILKIDSVFIMLPSDSQYIYLEIQDYSPGNITDFVHKKLHGPNYVFKRVLLNYSNHDLILGMNIALYDRVSGTLVSSTKFDETLFRDSRVRYYLK
ncbi:hypothetical protein TRIP_C10044 [Candidatus Zixiibacteriota bacterium]|nr:hypothetical protein TRIP_C10044 [candidate division Zixibacteria bacterium]